MKRMKTAGACLLATTLASCAGMPPVDLCKHADVRRQVYVTTIAAADALVAARRSVPTAVTLGREAAATALTVLDLNCPPPAR